MYRNDIYNARKSARENLKIMKANHNVFNRVKNGNVYKQKLNDFLFQKEELTPQQCSYINEVIYEIFL